MQARDKGGMAPGRVKSFADPGEMIGFTGANSTQVLHALTFRFLPHTFIPHDQGLHPLLLKLAQAILRLLPEKSMQQGGRSLRRVEQVTEAFGARTSLLSGKQIATQFAQQQPMHAVTKG